MENRNDGISEIWVCSISLVGRHVVFSEQSRTENLNTENKGNTYPVTKIKRDRNRMNCNNKKMTKLKHLTIRISNKFNNISVSENRRFLVMQPTKQKDV